MQAAVYEFTVSPRHRIRAVPCMCQDAKTQQKEAAPSERLPSSFNQKQVVWQHSTEKRGVMECSHACEQTSAAKRRPCRRPASVWACVMAALFCVAATAAYILWKSDAILCGLPVEPVLQEPALPNGCEAASLASVLGYYGVQADMLDLAYAYIPRQDFYEDEQGNRIGPDPEYIYPGDPATSIGFYCFAGAVCEGANKYLEASGSSLRAYDVTGITQAGLERYLADGTPVIVWVTTDWQAPRAGTYTWYVDDTGELYTPYVNLHCLVLTAMGQTKCKTSDPLRGEQTVDKQTFLDIFALAGSHAVIIH